MASWRRRSSGDRPICCRPRCRPKPSSITATWIMRSACWAATSDPTGRRAACSLRQAETHEQPASRLDGVKRAQVGQGLLVERLARRRWPGGWVGGALRHDRNAALDVQLEDTAIRGQIAQIREQQQALAGSGHMEDARVEFALI